MKSYARMQHEAAEGGKRLPESAGYGGAAVREPPRKLARVQIECAMDEPDARTDLASMGLDSQKLRELRSQYGHEDAGGLARLGDITPSHRKRSMTRCVPHLDCGATEGSTDGARLFCLDFARGRCPDGPACTHRHEIRGAATTTTGSAERDHGAFGRKRSLLLSAWERHHGKKEEGAMETGNCTLHVSGLRAPPKKRTELCGGAGAKSRSVAGDLDAAGHWALVTYAARAAAEFAKEAMTGQGLRVDGGEIIQVRWAKDQQATSNAGGYCHAPQAKPVPRLPPAQTARPAPAPRPAPPLPPGWAATLDAASGRHYYHHAASGTVQWDAPAAPAEEPDALPPGWARVAPVLCADGETLYNRVEVRETGDELLFMCNGVPDYAPRKISGGVTVESDWRGLCRSGRLDRNPNKIVAQDYRFRVPVVPGAPLETPITATPMGHYHQYPRCVVGASALGLDAPDALIAALKDDADLTAAPLAKALAEQIARGEPSKCIGVAFDGHPIMGPIGVFGGEVRLARPSFVGPLDVSKGDPVFVAGSGDLDACNGATGADGVWRYYATVRLEGDDVVPAFPYVIGAYRSQPAVTNFPQHQRSKVAP
ncbi:RNA binding-protein [Aureococcus anophagefferens]|nr:RNA binding-protein [Aureococcus anophagefferens]